jgi:hypothetical protein
MDVLSMIIGGTMEDATPDTMDLAAHVFSCKRGPGECGRVFCEEAKKKVEHYRQCEDACCLQCTAARAMIARSQGQITDDFYHRVIQQKNRYMDALRVLEEIKTSGTPEDDPDMYRCKRERLEERNRYVVYAQQIHDKWRRTY